MKNRRKFLEILVLFYFNPLHSMDISQIEYQIAKKIERIKRAKYNKQHSDAAE